MIYARCIRSVNFEASQCNGQLSPFSSFHWRKLTNRSFLSASLSGTDWLKLEYENCGKTENFAVFRTLFLWHLIWWKMVEESEKETDILLLISCSQELKQVRRDTMENKIYWKKCVESFHRSNQLHFAVFWSNQSVL